MGRRATGPTMTGLPPRHFDVGDRLALEIESAVHIGPAIGHQLGLLAATHLVPRIPGHIECRRAPGTTAATGITPKVEGGSLAAICPGICLEFGSMVFSQAEVVAGIVHLGTGALPKINAIDCAVQVWFLGLKGQDYPSPGQAVCNTVLPAQKPVKIIAIAINATLRTDTF